MEESANFTLKTFELIIIFITFFFYAVQVFIQGAFFKNEPTILSISI